MISVRFLFVVSCMLMLFACQEQQIGTPVTEKTPLVGKWESGSRTFEVFEDGKLVLTDILTKESTTGSYQFINNVVFRVKLGALGVHDYKAYIHEDELFLTSLDGESFIGYTKCSPDVSVDNH